MLFVNIERRIILLILSIISSFQYLITPFEMFYGVKEVVDTAVHVWSTGEDPFPFVINPPGNLIIGSNISDNNITYSK